MLIWLESKVYATNQTIDSFDLQEVKQVDDVDMFL